MEGKQNREIVRTWRAPDIGAAECGVLSPNKQHLLRTPVYFRISPLILTLVHYSLLRHLCSAL